MVWAEWVEPFFESETVYMKVSREAAIKYQKAIGSRLGKPYPNDEAALDDFIVVNWATIREE